MKLHAEFIRICAPIKRQVQVLDVRPRLDFHDLLIDLIGELKRERYRLSNVSKHYRVGERWQVDSFWRREVIQDNIVVSFVCKLVVSLKGDFRIALDFDFWFEFPAIRESVRARLHDFLFPRHPRKIVTEATRTEIARVWGKIEEVIQAELMRRFPEGWGRHGLDERAGRRDAKRVYHAGELTLTRVGDFSRFLSALRGVDEDARSMARESAGEVKKIAEEAFKGLVPPPPKTGVESLLVAVISRHREGVFEYQLRRLAHENSATSPNEITDILRRLELWGYIIRHPVPREVRRELEKLGIRRFLGFYTPGPVEPPKATYPSGAYARGSIRPEPLPLTAIPDFLRAPRHLVNRAILRMLRRRILRKRKTENHLGTRVTECRIARSPRGLSELELEILRVITRHHQKQLELLHRMKTQVGSPESTIYPEGE